LLPRFSPTDSPESADFPTPDEYRALLDDPDCTLFMKERLLLMWWQRELIAKWFRDYNPASFVHADEKPYDFDRHCQLVEQLVQRPAGVPYSGHAHTINEPLQAPPLPG
jgi:hypothetical protein